jgi:hypothetical protein
MIILRENIQPLGNSFVQFQVWNQFLTSHIQHETDYKANRKIHTFQGIHETTDRTLKRIVRKGTDELLYSNGTPVSVEHVLFRIKALGKFRQHESEDMWRELMLSVYNKTEENNIMFLTDSQACL